MVNNFPAFWHEWITSGLGEEAVDLEVGFPDSNFVQIFYCF